MGSLDNQSSLLNIFPQRKRRPVEHDRGKPSPDAGNGLLKAGAVVQVQNNWQSGSCGQRFYNGGQKIQPADPDGPLPHRKNDGLLLLLRSQHEGLCNVDVIDVERRHGSVMRLSPVQDLFQAYKRHRVRASSSIKCYRSLSSASGWPPGMETPSVRQAPYR